MPISTLFAGGNQPNIVIIITDQERDLSEWPESYQATLASALKARAQLMANGLSFDNAFTGACMCTPSRATFLTSNYPIVTGATTTGVSVLPDPSDFPNIATVLAKAGYTSYWIGKWHLLGPEEPGSGASDLSQWGFQAYTAPGSETGAWDPPDAGLTLGATTLGGGTQGPTAYNQNDQRFLKDALSFLASPPSGPWCLVISLVNPHDVHLGYEAQDGTYYDASSYSGLNVPLPNDVGQDPSTLPRGQRFFTWANRASATASQQDFVNFYAYLMQSVDGQIGQILSAMQGMLEETLIIRFADHGEMGLSHGLVEKFVSAHSECTHVPLIFSNPKAYPTGVTTEAMASTVDLAPTLASLLGVSASFTGFVGADLSPVLNDPSQSVQEYLHFTYDDIEGDGPSVIRSIRSSKWVYSTYLLSTMGTGYVDSDWEMYDLTNDPNEDNNLAGTSAHVAEQTRLDQALQSMMVAKGTAPAWYPANWPPQVTAASVGGPPPNNPPRDYPVAKVTGASAAQASALRYVGVKTTADLLQRTSTPEARAKLATLVPVDDATLAGWIASAEALRSRTADSPAR